MNMRKKSILLCLMLLAAAVLVTGCGGNDVYKENDKLGYNVSVEFDANGGSFASGNTPVIVDSFNLSEMTPNSEGNVEIPLLAPQGRKNVVAQKNGCFLIGWYAQRTENADGTYTYAQPWDFEKDRVTVNPKESHKASQPVLTLYAAWAPMYQVEFYDIASNTLIGEYVFNPEGGTELTLPAWDEATGAMKMENFPQKEGFTFVDAYYDEGGTQKVETATISHPGIINRENGTVENRTMKLYTSWKEGQWFRITSAQQFAKNFSLNGYYDIQADLDFTDEIWPTAAMHGNFSGKIQGNGHTVSNICIEQTNTNKVYTGLFGNLLAEATVSDVTFQNVELIIRKGSRLNGVAYGLLAGNLATGDSLQNVTVQNSRICIDSGCYLMEDGYTIGLVCGLGSCQVDNSGITCAAVGESPESVNITVVNGAVQVQFGAEENM